MFTIRWRRSARDELATRWINADSALRKAITVATYAIEKALAQNPEEKGESRPNSRRIYFHAPLGVLFKVNAEKATVIILHVWVY
jgi:hypothetical protein